MDDATATANRSPRVELAELADQALDAMPGVALVAAPGLRRAAAIGNHGVPGVLATAQADGRYGLEVSLEVAWPSEPLAVVAENARRRILDAVEVAGLQAQLGVVDVMIRDIAMPREAV